MTNLVAALYVVLKVLSVEHQLQHLHFGTGHDFFWPKSGTFDQHSLNSAVQYIADFRANGGGTNIYRLLEAAFKRRYGDVNLDVSLLNWTVR